MKFILIILFAVGIYSVQGNLLTVSQLLQNQNVQNILDSPFISNYYETNPLFAQYITIDWAALFATPPFQTFLQNPDIQALLLQGNLTQVITSPIIDAAFQQVELYFMLQNPNVLNILNNPIVENAYVNNPLFSAYVYNGQVNWTALLATPPFQALLTNNDIQEIILTGNITLVINSQICYYAFQQVELYFMQQNSNVLSLLNNPIVENFYATNPLFSSYVSNGQVNWTALMATPPFQALLLNENVQAVLLTGNLTLVMNSQDCNAAFQQDF